MTESTLAEGRAAVGSLGAWRADVRVRVPSKMRDMQGSSKVCERDTLTYCHHVIRASLDT